MMKMWKKQIIACILSLTLMASEMTVFASEILTETEVATETVIESETVAETEIVQETEAEAETELVEETEIIEETEAESETETEDLADLFEADDLMDDPLFFREMAKWANAGISTMSLESEAERLKIKHNSKMKGATLKYGVDVSSWQNTIDWAKAKADGVEFAIIRAGFRGWGTGKLCIDDKAQTNIKNALKQGIKVGVYVYSQAITKAEAIEEANLLINAVKDYRIDMPLVLDFEYPYEGGTPVGRLANANLSVQQATDIALAFCSQVKKAGYEPMIYANKYAFQNDLNADTLRKEAKIWLAQYNDETTYSGMYDFWQFTSTGKVNGIEGGVDLNFWYDFEKMPDNPQAFIPVIRSAEYKNGACEITWDRATGAQGYQILRKDYTGEWKEIASVGQSTYNYRDTDIYIGETYQYSIRCQYTQDGSIVSDFDQTGKKVTVTAEVPYMRSVSYIQDHMLHITWETSMPAEKYYVYRKIDNGVWKFLATTTQDSYDDYVVADGHTYTYAVAAGYLDRNNKEQHSEYDSVGKSIKTAVGITNISSAQKKTYDSIEIKWTAASGAKEYLVYRKIDNGSWKQIKTVTGTAFTDTNLDLGHTYQYRIIGRAKVDNITVTGSYGKDSTSVKLVMGAVEGLKLTQLANRSIKLSWNKVEGTTGYRVYRKINGAANWTQIDTVMVTNSSAGTSYTIKNLKDKTNYTYTVRAYHKNSDGSKALGDYNRTGVSVYYGLAMPKLVSVKSKNYKTLQVKWEKVSGADYYDIYRYTKGSSWKKIKRVSGTTSAYNDSSCTMGVKYYYRVKAIDKKGTQEYTSSFATEKSGTSVMPAPYLSSLKSQKSGVSLTWKKRDGAQGYIVYRKVAGGSWSQIKTLSGGNSLKYVDKTAKKGKTYYYSIRGYRTINGKKVLGAFNSTGKKIKDVY